ncbi:MAG: signal peptide peptidase SppA [Prevotellaceae bacterium]|jgi:protease-4|nr:signal peptide peptidase SppA [Prevotellaceae bacterium]
MKKFFKYVLATVVGLIIFAMLQLILLFAIVGVMSTAGSSTVNVKPNTIFELKLKGQLVERSSDSFTSILISQLNKSQSSIALDDILLSIQKASKDENINGIYLEMGSLSASPASIQEIRKALEEFKKSGKFVISYGDYYGNGTYYLASVSDKIYLNPEGSLMLTGLSASTTFYKDLLDKIGVKMQIFKVGTFKSAVEPFTATKMSDANRLQMSTLIQSIWDNMTESIAQSRNISVADINSYVNSGSFLDEAQVALDAKLVDTLIYRNEVKKIIEQRVVKQYNTVNLSEMKRVAVNEKTSTDKIAVLYAVGGIDDGSSSGMVSEKIAEALIKLSENDKIKAVVMRVNSPGGSAYGSEQIWNAAEVVRAKKPFVVSMGDYAASGGYYISCAADAIFAQPNTLTGSIGIFGMFPDMQGLYDKVGLASDMVKTNKFSDLGDTFRPMTAEEKALFQKTIERGYELFTTRCANGRKMSIDGIKAIAEGRVYSGTDALKLGLVDFLGNLDDAIKFAAEQAKISSYSLRYFPEQDDFMTQIMEAFSTSVANNILKNNLGENYLLFDNLKKAQSMYGIQALMPVEIVIK